MNSKQKEYVNRNTALLAMLGTAVPAGLDVVLSLVKQTLSLNQTLDKKDEISKPKSELKDWIKNMKTWSEEFDGDLGQYSDWLAQKVSDVIPRIEAFTKAIGDVEVRERGSGGTATKNTEFMFGTKDGESIYTDQKLCNLFMASDQYKGVLSGSAKFADAFSEFLKSNELKLKTSKKIEHDTPQTAETVLYLVSRKIMRELGKPFKTANPNRKEREPKLPEGQTKDAS